MEKLAETSIQDKCLNVASIEQLVSKIGVFVENSTRRIVDPVICQLFCNVPVVMPGSKVEELSYIRFANIAGEYGGSYHDSTIYLIGLDAALVKTLMTEEQKVGTYSGRLLVYSDSGMTGEVLSQGTLYTGAKLKQYLKTSAASGCTVSTFGLELEDDSFYGMFINETQEGYLNYAPKEEA